MTIQKSAEDYLEMILRLHETKGYARARLEATLQFRYCKGIVRQQAIRIHSHEKPAGERVYHH